jgi:hypothetical protein
MSAAAFDLSRGKRTMPVSVEEVRADIVPETAAAPERQPQAARPLDMERVTRELRRAADRRARIWTD